MAVTNPGIKTFTAASTTTAYRAVKLSAANTVAVTSATTDRVIGIALNQANAGEPVAVQLFGSGGTYKITAGAAVSVGSACHLIATAGKYHGTSTGGSAAPHFVAVDAATADGDIIEAVQAAPGIVA